MGKAPSLSLGKGLVCFTLMTLKASLQSRGVPAEWK